MILSWLHRLLSTNNPKSAGGVSGRVRVARQRPPKLKLEILEGRLAPAGVTNLFLNAGPLINNVAAAPGTTVPVFIDAGDLSTGAGGFGSGTFYVKYDPTVLALNEAAGAPPGPDIKLGSLLSAFAANYQVESAAGFGVGTVGVGIVHNGTTFYTGTAGGHLVELDFHVLQPTSALGSSTLLDFVNRVTFHLINISDSSLTKYQITPTPTTYAGAQTQPGALTPAGFSPADTDPADATIQIVPAAVSGVSAQWGTQSIALQTAGDGLRLLPAGRSNDMPWVNLNAITITLTGPATLTAADVTATGITVADYGPVTISGSGTSYTITLHQAIAKADRVTITIGNADITTFTGRLDVLPGDVNDDGVVNITDGASILVSILEHEYSPFQDLNGDGSVNLTDLLLWLPYYGTKLPNLAAMPASSIVGGVAPGAAASLTPEQLTAVLDGWIRQYLP
jgi:hypothetical protein